MADTSASLNAVAVQEVPITWLPDKETIHVLVTTCFGHFCSVKITSQPLKPYKITARIPLRFAILL